MWTTGYLAWFCSLLVQFYFKLIPFNKNINQNSISRTNSINFEFLIDERKAIKKTSSGLIGKCTLKKIQIPFESSFPRNLISFFVFTSHLETSHFSYQGSVIDNLNYSLMRSNEQKIRFQGINHVFLASTLSFRNFKWNFDFLFEVLLNKWSPMA